MKIKKLISIIMTMNDLRLERLSHEEATQTFMNSVDEMYDAVQTIESYLKLKGNGFESVEKPANQGGYSMKLRVVDKDQQGILARIKFFPILEGEAVPKDIPLNGRIDMILINTDDQGYLEVDLPVFGNTGYQTGDVAVVAVKGYLIEASKGSEYSIQHVYHPVDADKHELLLELDRFVDIYTLGWYAGDLHHHSIYSSPKFGGTDDVIEWPDEVRNHMIAAGLSFGALSDHHNILNHEKWMSVGTDRFLPIVSKEISTSNGHVMSLNVKTDVIYTIPESSERNHDFLLKEFIRITEEIKFGNGLAQINHPRDMNPSISLSSKMTEHIELFDTMEIWNGSIPMLSGTTNDQAFKLWLRLLREGRYIPATCGSDTHNTKADDYHLLFDELQYFVYQLKRSFELLREEETLGKAFELASQLIDLFEKNKDLFEQWAKTSLGSGCVRTYIHSPKGLPLSESDVLDHLRSGNSFLTNGPIVIASINDTKMGETYVLNDDKKVVFLKVFVAGNRELDQLQIITREGVLCSINLKIDRNSSDTIEFPIEVEKLCKEDWIVVRVTKDHTYQGITNPIFLK